LVSDWSSDVCSSDLVRQKIRARRGPWILREPYRSAHPRAGFAEGFQVQVLGFSKLPDRIRHRQQPLPRAYRIARWAVWGAAALPRGIISREFPSAERTEMRLLLNWLLSAISLLIVSKVVHGFEVHGLVAALIAALVIGLINATL